MACPNLNGKYDLNEGPKSFYFAAMSGCQMLQAGRVDFMKDKMVYSTLMFRNQKDCIGCEGSFQDMGTFIRFSYKPGAVTAFLDYADKASQLCDVESIDMSLSQRGELVLTENLVLGLNDTCSKAGTIVSKLKRIEDSLDSRN
jgi:hypothetical protein